MSRYDIDAVKTAASGRWRDIIQSVAGISDDYLTTKHGPCPIHQGSTKFRVFSDFDKCGGAVCNDCGKMGDGFALIEKMTGKTFAEALSLVANYLDIQPTERKSKKKSEPADRLEIFDADPLSEDLGFATWCLQKPPITSAALRAVGTKLGRFRWCDESFSVLAVPVWGPKLNEENPVGWVLYEITGQKLPSGKREEVEWAKVRLSAKCGRGLICDPARLKDAKTILKLEGPPDALAAIGATDIPADVFPFTTVNGSEETPLPWMIDLATGREAIICHDADQAGERGADKWAGSLASKAITARKVVLPYDIEPKHGKDFRDWLTDEEHKGNWEKFLELESRVMEAAEPPETKPVYSDDDPHRLAIINLEKYKDSRGGRLVFWNDQWWKYKAGRYQSIALPELRAKVTAAIVEEFKTCWVAENERYQEWIRSDSYSEARDKGPPKMTKVTRNLTSNVIGNMEAMCCITSNIQMPCWLPTREKRNYLVMENGILDLDELFNGADESSCLLPHSSEWFSYCKLDYKFDSDAQCPKWLEYLRYSMEGDRDRIAVLQEWAGYLLAPENYLQRFLVLEGEGRNGKTVFFAAMTAMLGAQNVSHVSIEQFSEKFALASTIGKMANISGDAGEIDHVAEGKLKMFTGNDSMEFDRKNRDPIDIKVTAKLMAAWNTRPKIKDKTDGVWRRMILMPFRKQILKEKIVRGMDTPEWWLESGETCGILKWALIGLNRLRMNGDFSHSQICEDNLTGYKIETNPASEFLLDYIEPDENSYVDCKTVYHWYDYWCKKTNHKPLASGSFGKEISRKFPTVERKRDREQSTGALVWRYYGIKFSESHVLGEKIEF